MIVLLTQALFISASASSFTSSSSSSSPYQINISSIGRRFDGYGAISGGGATSRLLFSYSEPYLSDILDFLFLPNYGVSLHHLKLEIGGDGQSSEGVEPSHAHFDGDADFTRGYEWRLMVEAKKRNPNILISVLAWTWPGFLGTGGRGLSPWNNPQKSAEYIIDWIVAARDIYNVTVDFVDADWNERGWSSDFVIILRNLLDKAGFTSTSLICGDDAHKFSCANKAASNSTLRNSIIALGVHGPDAPDPIALNTRLALWGTEVHAPDPGGEDLVAVFLSLYSTFDVSGFLLWNLVSAYNPGLFSPDWGTFRAWWPWSNHYELDGRAWVFAHFTQATLPGWTFVSKEGGGSGTLSLGGAWNVLVDSASGGLTLIVSKPMQGTTPEVAQFSLSTSSSGTASLPTSLHAMKSIVIAGSDFGRNLTDYFVEQVDISVVNGMFSVSLEPGDLWTISTVQMVKGATKNIPPPASSFPRSWADDFDECPISQEGEYFTDQTGVFECVNDTQGGRGVVMRQMVPTHPVAWRPDEQRPFTIFASDITWSSVDVSIDFRLSAAGEVATIGARANPNCCGRVITGEDYMPGAWLSVGEKKGGWTLYNAIANVTSANGVLTSGSLTLDPLPGEWHRLRLVIDDKNLASFFYDGIVAFQGKDLTDLVPIEGFVGFGTGTYGHFVEYDRFNVTAN